MKRHNNLPILIVIIVAASAGILLFAQPARAATNRYVVRPSHCNNFPGMTPCYTTLISAMNASGAGDTIIILENLNYGIEMFDTVNNVPGLTIKGSAANGTITVPTLGFALANNLTVQDLTMEVLDVVNVTTKVHVQNITANGIYVSPTGDLNATVEFVNNKLPLSPICGGAYCDMAIVGAEGKRLDGVFTMQGNTAGAINILAHINSTTTAVLGATVVFESNIIQSSANVGVRRFPDTTHVGAGNITGSITFNNNTVYELSNGLNVTIDSHVHGSITNDITFTNNHADKIACITFDADPAYNNFMTGDINVTNNVGEVIELGFRGDFTGKIINVTNNVLNYHGGIYGASLTVRANRFSSGTIIDVGDNTGKMGIVFDTFTGSNDSTVNVYRNTTYYVTYHTATAQVGRYTLTDNTMSGPFPENPPLNPDWGLVVFITGTGSINNATIQNNVADRIYFMAGSNVAGNVLIEGNTFKGSNLIAANGSVGAGKVTMKHNRLGTTTSDRLDFIRVNGDVNFNAIMGPLYPYVGTVNAQRNWWGCNGGPGSCFATGVPNSSPWLKFSATAVCTAANNKISVGYFVNYDSSGVAWNNISIPGNVSVSTSAGSVAAPNPKPLKPDFSWNATMVNVPANAVATISARLDSQTQTISNKQCITRTDTIGVFRSSTGTWLLNNANDASAADVNATFGNSNWLPVVGDWNGDGVDSIGGYDQTTGVFYLRNSNSTGTPDYSFVLGDPGDTPMAGRWDPTMSASGAGVFRPSNGVIYLKRTLTTGYSDYHMVLGDPGDKGVAGDWDGDGYDGAGVFRSSEGRWYLSNDGTANGIIFDDGFADFGPINDANVRPVVGDWNADGVTGIGYLLNGTFFLRNTPVGDGTPNPGFAFGAVGDYPVAGHWTAAAYAPPVSLNNVIVQPGSTGANGVEPGAAD